MPLLTLLSTFLVALVLAVTPSPSLAAQPPIGVIGKDDRHVLLEQGQPWDAIGRVERGGMGFCTGILVAPDEVLTAAHCLWNDDRRQLLPATSLHFVAGFRRGTYKGHARAVSYRVDPALVFDSKGHPNRLPLDWAVLKLEQPLTGIKPVPLVARPLDGELTPGTRLTRAGYGRDRPYLPMIVEDCKPLYRVRDEPLLLHDCDSTFGDSGSPLLTHTAAGWRLVALQVAVVPFHDEPVGAAILFDLQIPPSMLR